MICAKHILHNNLPVSVNSPCSPCCHRQPLPTLLIAEFHEESGRVEVGLDQLQLAVRKRNVMRREVMLVVKQRAGRLRALGEPLHVDGDLTGRAAVIGHEQADAPVGSLHREERDRAV